MDVLFNSIDVRDLLSTHDLDDSSPLSAPDLRLLIDRLQVRSLHIKSQVHQYLLSNRHDFEEIFAACSAASDRSAEISDTFLELLRLISDRPVDAEICDTIKEIAKTAREAREKRELLGLVRTIVELSERLKGVREDVNVGRLVIAAEKLRDLKKAIRVSEVEGGEPVVYGLLRKEWLQCFDEIQEVLVRFIEKAVQFEKEQNSVRVKYQLTVNEIDGVELHRVLEAMDVVGILDYGLAKVADLMNKYVIIPLLSCSSPISLVEELYRDSEQMTMADLKIVPSSDHKIEDMDGEVVYSRIIQVVKFIYKFICLQNGTWIQCFGRLTWPRISELIISNFLSKVVPNDASKLADFQKIIKQTSEFESVLKEMMFISASDDKDERLSNFAENVEVHFATRKKTEILAKARNLLLRCDFALPQEYTRKGLNLKNYEIAGITSDHVVELLFSSERCVVSEAALQLMELVHQTLKDVCLSSTRVALEFYHAARDAILLYEAVIPVKLERQLDGINQVAVLMHNDCLYLCQEILGLAFEYCSDFPSSIKEHVVFVDLAPRFQLKAEEILKKQIQLVIFNLKEAIDGADGFQNTHQMQQYESTKFSIDQVVFILEKVHIIWEPLLLPSTYRRSMGLVLESVFSRMAKDILLLDDVAAEETLQLQRLIHMMLENLSSLLESLIDVNQQRKLQDASVDSLNELIPSLRKVRKLEDLLDMPLKFITTAWESGELVNCGFTFTEMEDFIKSIFTDTPLRKECLWRIKGASF
ncbi:centromere/kinetochore protein zw10 homolog [Malania oleifera]|uniref:centromere/kinetochore protein zw10 homolog n=1 Tax=Malania oleifera TaxID=397392 RepID=UPI0025AE4F7C|nr:centromere/kinetochore protein zw10 homolog [Malania oleifera]XP_057955659.1 centromere/kinetochore protein zw10 homolog [Malania oleifera]XP_057955660.1 centromere/kinetochore protein zw10 homolog [Malania oleifera]